MFYLRLLKALTRFLYPAFCCFCGRPEVYVCTDCLNSNLYYESFINCPKCPGLLRNGELIHKVCSRRSALDGVLAVCWYEGNSRKLISSLKYQFSTKIAPILSNLINRRIGNIIKEIDLVVPAPLHPARNKWRGFNQSHLLATTIPLPLNDCLEKTQPTQAQAKLNRRERLTNLTGSFKVKEPQYVRGKRILLIDDVMTTGSTLEQCARALKSAGAKSVIGVVFAKDHSSFKANILQ